jgi:Lon protease-like protein
MSLPHDLDVSLSTFTGEAPLFPLPSGLLLPHLVQPLHVFEERYRQMTADALAGDRLLALGLLKPGWESDYESKQVPIYRTVCLGAITVDEQLEDGRYNIIVQGLCRARVRGELDTEHPYRVAQLELLADEQPHPESCCWEEYRRSLVEAFQERFPQLAHNVDLQRAVREDLALGVLADLLASSLQLDPLDAAEILAETDVCLRCEWVLERLGHEPEVTLDGGFPPDFSLN